MDAPAWLWSHDPAAWPGGAEEWETAVCEWFTARDLGDRGVWDVLLSVLSTPVYTEPPDGPA